MVGFSRVLVTGAAGFIGSRVSNRLLEAGLEVIGLDDLSNSNEETLSPGVKLLKGSVTDPSVTREAIAGVDVVLHFAARIGTRESAAEFLRDGDTNIMGTLNLLSLSRDAGVKRFIYASTAAVYGEVCRGIRISEDHELRPLSPYGISKLAAEMYVSNICASIGVDYLILRYFNVYGPGQRHGPYAGVITLFAGLVMNNKPPVLFGDGEQIRDFIHVDDVVRAIILGMESSVRNEVLNIGTGIPCSVNSLATLILKSRASALEPVHTPAVGQEIAYSLAETGRAEKLLGFLAQKDLYEGICETVNWIESQS